MSNQRAITRSGGGLKPKTEPTVDPSRISKTREKGLWNFLTWSFFLSQLVAAEQAAAANAASGATSDDMAPGERGAADSEANVAAAPSQLGAVAPTADASPDTVATAQTFNAPLAHELATPSDTVEVAQHRSANETAEPSHDGTISSSPSVPVHAAAAFETAPNPVGGHAVVAEVPANGPIGGNIHLPPLPGAVGDGVGDVVGGIVQPAVSTVGEILAPVLGTVDTVLHSLEPVLSQVLAPVVDITSDVVHLVEPVLKSVVTPVVDVAGDVVQLVEPIVGQLVAPVAGIVGGAIQPLNGVLDQVVAPLDGILVDPLTSLLGPALNHGDPIIAAPAASGSASVGATAGLHLDDLFSSGGYTEYGLALQSVVSTVLKPQSQSTATASTALDEHLAVTSTDGHEQSGAHAQHIGIPSALEELGLRGLGDGISL